MVLGGAARWWLAPVVWELAIDHGGKCDNEFPERIEDCLNQFGYHWWLEDGTYYYHLR